MRKNSYEPKLFESKIDNMKNDNFESKNQRYIEEVMERFEINLPETINKEITFAGSMKREHRTPKVFEGEERRGTWMNNKFFLNDDFIPKHSNPENYTIREIKKELKDKYNIILDGITYNNKIADFSSISVANISTKEIFIKANNMSSQKYDKLKTIKKLHQFSKVFTEKRRQTNFKLADEIAAEKQIKIPGLSDGYTKEQLTEWREKNRFSWDENLSGGYFLVPSVIHLNLGHTGLVSIAKNAYMILKKRHKQMKKEPESFCWDENDAPISISELKYCKKVKVNKKNKGVKSMPKFKSLNLGNHIERPHNMGISEINKSVSDEFSEWKETDELGEKFLSDKNKLENEREKIKSANINAEAKKEMLEIIDLAMKKIEIDYEKQVEEKQKENEAKIEEYLEIMEQYEIELNEKLQSLTELNNELQTAEVDGAIDDAQKNINTLNLLKNQFTENLGLRMQQSEMQRRNIRARNLSGK